MIAMSCHVFDKETGDQVFYGFENGGYRIFENLKDFYDYMHYRYNVNSRDNYFVISGCEVDKNGNFI